MYTNIAIDELRNIDINSYAGQHICVVATKMLLLD
jgi:hypothetical protein